MIAIAFIAFAILIVGWLMAPNGEVKAEAPVPAPNLKPSAAQA